MFGVEMGREVGRRGRIPVLLWFSSQLTILVFLNTTFHSITSITMLSSEVLVYKSWSWQEGCMCLTKRRNLCIWLSNIFNLIILAERIKFINRLKFINSERYQINMPDWKIVLCQDGHMQRLQYPNIAIAYLLIATFHDRLFAVVYSEAIQLLHFCWIRFALSIATHGERILWDLPDKTKWQRAVQYKLKWSIREHYKWHHHISIYV